MVDRKLSLSVDIVELAYRQILPNVPTVERVNSADTKSPNSSYQLPLYWNIYTPLEKRVFSQYILRIDLFQK